jgi:hypothetical protein
VLIDVVGGDQRADQQRGRLRNSSGRSILEKLWNSV